MAENIIVNICTANHLLTFLTHFYFVCHVGMQDYNFKMKMNTSFLMEDAKSFIFSMRKNILALGFLNSTSIAARVLELKVSRNNN